MVLPHCNGMRRNSGEKMVLRIALLRIDVFPKGNSNFDRPLTQFFKLYRLVEFSSTSSSSDLFP